MLLKMFISFRDDMKCTVQYDGSSSDLFPILKRGCVLPWRVCTLWRVLLLAPALRLPQAFLHTRSDGNLLNFARFRTKTKVRKVPIREMLFAADAVLTAHTEEALQRLITCFTEACNEFRQTISLKKTNIMGQVVSETSHITIGDHTLEVVNNFTYLSSCISSNLSLDSELDVRIGKAAPQWLALPREFRTTPW